MLLVTSFLLSIVISLVIYLLVWARRHYQFWKNKGVIYPKPIYFLGNSLPIKQAPMDLYDELYSKYSKEKYVGFYELAKIKLMIRDPELIHRVITKDFSYFHDRFEILEDDIAPEDNGLFIMNGRKWRAVRNKLSPVFTSGRLKSMFDQMLQACKNLNEDVLNGLNADIEMRDLMFSYTSDIIASCAFGIDVHSDKQKGREFRETGMKTFQMSMMRLMKLLVAFNFPKFGRFYRLHFTPPEVARYFGLIVKEGFRYRRENNVSRNDFLQLLMQLQEKGDIEVQTAEPDDEYLSINKESTTESFHMSEELLMAQAYTFLTAGMEPSANTLMFACLELAHNQEIQDKVRREINEVLAKHGGFTYQAVKEMAYLELCILETLRLYPVAKQLVRLCTKQYNLDGVIVEPGVNIQIPLKCLHHDPTYFENPLSFNPERFDEPSYPLGSYLPFGDGPRICIGMRFAMVEMKLGLGKLLHQFRLRPSPKTAYPVPLNRFSFFSVPSGPVFLSLHKIQS